MSVLEILSLAAVWAASVLAMLLVLWIVCALHESWHHRHDDRRR